MPMNINIEELFQKIEQGKKAGKKIREYFGPGIESDLKRKKIRYLVHLTNGIISATINRCLERYGKKVTQSEFDENLKKSFNEQYFVYLIKCSNKVRNKDAEFRSKYNSLKDKYIKICIEHIECLLSGLSKSEKAEIEDGIAHLIANETWNVFEDQLLERKDFELTTSLEKYLKTIAENKTKKAIKESKEKKSSKVDKTNNDDSNNVYNKRLKFIKTIDRVALKIFYELEDTPCKKYLSLYYRPMLYNMIKFTKSDLTELAQNNLVAVNQSIKDKLSQKEALEIAGIPPKDHPAREHKTCLEKWQEPLFVKLQRPQYETVLAELIDTFREHLKKKKSEKITKKIHAN